jgi:hypothetical protein
VLVVLIQMLVAHAIASVTLTIKTLTSKLLDAVVITRVVNVQHVMDLTVCQVLLALVTAIQMLYQTAMFAMTMEPRQREVIVAIAVI